MNKSLTDMQTLESKKDIQLEGSTDNDSANLPDFPRMLTKMHTAE